MDVVALGLAKAAVKTSTLRKTVDLSGGDVTIDVTTVQSRVVDLTGATATRTVTFPNVAFCCRVTNSTDYAQTIKRSGGTGTLTLEPGGSIELVA